MSTSQVMLEITANQDELADGIKTLRAILHSDADLVQAPRGHSMSFERETTWLSLIHQR